MAVIDQQERLKHLAAAKAMEFVESGMVLGLGEGSTTLLAVRRLGTLLADGELRDIVGVPASPRMAREARALGIPLTTLEEQPCIDLTIDGADEVDPQLDLIKGGGGALLREKIIARATCRELIIVDDSKLVPRLGSRWAIPVEVVPFGYSTRLAWLRSLGSGPALRMRDGQPFRSDNGNFIVDCNFGPLKDAAGLAQQIKAETGIVEHGLFLGLATDVIVAGADGIRHLQATRRPDQKQGRVQDG